MENKHTEKSMAVSADVFLELLRQNTSHPQTLLDAFCLSCWDFEERRKECFEAFGMFCKNLPQEEKKAIIPLLVNKSKSYPLLVFLAEELFGSLPESEQKTLKIDMIHWTYDEKTNISQEEYFWRRFHSLPCGKTTAGYCRPLEPTDLECFYKVLSMMYATGKETNFYMHGY